MKVKATRKFRDLKEGKVRKAGEEFVVSKDRFEEIEGRHKGLVVPIDEKPKDEKPEDSDPEDEKPENDE